MSTNGKMSKERDDIEMLLPWYESGTLDDADRKRVDAWLAKDPSLGDRLALVREEREAAVEANEAAGAPGPGALDRLMASIEAEAKPSLAAGKADLGGWVSRLFGAPVPAGLQWAAAAAVILIIVQAGALGVLVSSGGLQGVGYETASRESTVPAEGTFALVRFSDEASASEIAGFLSEADMVIVDGPKPGGVWKIRLSAAKLTGAERDELLKKLRENPNLVTMAVPAD